MSSPASSSGSEESSEFAVKLQKKKKRRTFDDDDNDNDERFDGAARSHSKPLAFVSSGRDAVSDDADERPSFGLPSFGLPSSSAPAKKPAGGKLRKADTSFERYTKGIGSKLLAKMGYVGGGMAPIDVKVRPKGVGLGFGNFEEKTASEKRREAAGEKHADEDEVEEKEEDLYENDAMRRAAKAVAAEERDRDGWKRGKQRQPRTQYITSLDQESRAAAEKRVASVGIIDMRGPPAGGDGAARKRMPELYYNVRLLVDVLRVELIELDAKQAKRREQLAVLDADHERVLSHSAAERDRLIRLERVRGLVEECSKRVRERRIDLTQVSALFGALRANYAREYELFRLSRLVHSLVAPLLGERMRGWAPLSDDDPVAVASVFRAWRDLLLPSDLLDDETALLVASDAVRYDARLFQKLVDDHVLPPLRVALMRTWRPEQNSDAAIALLLAWRGVLPRRAFAALLDAMVVPRIERVLADADQRRVDALSMHRWLAPWQTLLGAAFEPLLPSIGQLLVGAVERCDARLDDAHAALHAWSHAGLGDTQLQRLLERVVGAMERRLRSVPLNPAAPDSSALEAVLRWFDFAPLAVVRLVHVVEENFFAPWFDITRQWLAGEPDFGELSDWYAGWKTFFPAPLLEAAPRLRTLFNHALDLLKCGFVRLQLPAAPAVPTRARMRAQAAEQTTRFGVADDAPAPVATDDEPFLSSINDLREAVSEMASERGVLFQRAARQYDNRDAYTLGAALVRFENGLLLERQANGDWKPASIDELLDRAIQPTAATPRRPQGFADID
jgi:tuftelin-interacting protein 11